MLFQFGEDAIARYAGPLRKSVERIGPNGFLEVFRRHRTVRTRPYPGLRNLTLAGLLKFLDQLTKASAQDASCSAPAIIFSRPDTQSDPSPAACVGLEGDGPAGARAGSVGELPRTPLPLNALYASKASNPKVMGDMPPAGPLVLVLTPPRGPFLIPFRTSDKPMVDSLINEVRRLNCVRAQ